VRRRQRHQTVNDPDQATLVFPDLTTRGITPKSPSITQIPDSNRVRPPIRPHPRTRHQLQHTPDLHRPEEPPDAAQRNEPDKLRIRSQRHPVSGGESRATTTRQQQAAIHRGTCRPRTAKKTGGRRRLT
jgi:hypothetical protein